MRLNHALLALALFCSPGALFAAENGDLGTTSTGETEVSISIPDLVRITMEGDIELTASVFDGSAVSGKTNLCIYRNGSDSVSIQISSSSGGAGGFVMDSGASSLPYSVDVLLADDTAVHQTVAVGQSYSLTGANTSSHNCGGNSWTHQLQATVGGTELMAASVGDYQDTVTVLVSPN